MAVKVEKKQIGIIGEASRRAVAKMRIQIQNQHSPDSPTPEVVNPDRHIVDGRQGAAVVWIGVMTAAAKHSGHPTSQRRIYGIQKCPKNRERNIDTAREPRAPS
jgi:hypothetical protein